MFAVSETVNAHMRLARDPIYVTAVHVVRVVDEHLVARDAVVLGEHLAQVDPPPLDLPMLGVGTQIVIPAAIAEPVQLVQVDRRLWREAEDEVGTQQRAEQHRRVAAGRAAHHHNAFGAACVDLPRQEVAHLLDTTPGETAVIPGTVQVTHKQPFRLGPLGDLEELERGHPRHPEGAVEAAERDQQHARRRIEPAGRLRVRLHERDIATALAPPRALAPDQVAQATAVPAHYLHRHNVSAARPTVWAACRCHRGGRPHGAFFEAGNLGAVSRGFTPQRRAA